MATPLSALVVEDSEPDAEILAFQLRKGGYDVRYDRVDSEAAMRESLARGSFDIVFCDYMIPGFGAQAAFDLLRQVRRDLPFVVVSAVVDEDGVADLLIAGADDFIAKGRYARLTPIVRRALATAAERRSRERLETALELQAQRDALTGLPTRAAFIERVRQALADGQGTPTAVVRLDLDHFGRVNESFGHELGDDLLRDVAARLAAGVPTGSPLARIASDEFGVLAIGEEAGRHLIEQLLTALERPFVVGGQALHLSASIGTAVSPLHGKDAATLMRRAGAAAARAKRTGAPTALFSPEDERVGLGIAEIEELRGAIDRGELTLYYQPQVEGPRLVPVGVEALVRWMHPKRGLIPPAAFLPLVREGGLGRRLTRWVLEEALAQGRAWWLAGFEVPVAVNLTMEDAQDPALTDGIAELLAAHELPARALELELTEDTAITDPVAIEQTVRRLNALGARIAIDDFGTGYATLTYLQRLPVHRLKIDRSFVQGLTSRPADAAIVRSAVELGHELGLSVLAEGVEDDATWERLRDLGCDGAQGYAFARPMPFLELGRWLSLSPLGPAREKRRAHAARFLALAESAGAEGLAGERRAERLRELRREKHNLDLVLDGAIVDGDAETALRLASALRFFWVDRGVVVAGVDALQRALALPAAQAPTPPRAAALNALGVLLGQQEDYVGARPLLVEAARVARRLGDRRALAASTNNLGMVLDALGELDAARDAYLESMAMRRAIGDPDGEALALNNLGSNAYYRGELATSRTYAQRALEVHRGTGDDYGVAVALDTIGAIALDEGDLSGALSSYQSSLGLYRDLGVQGDATQPMAGIAMVAAEMGATERALIIAGAVAGLRDRYPSLPPINAERYERCLAGLAAQVSQPERAKDLVEGRSLGWEEAVALALGFAIPKIGSAVPPVTRVERS